MKRALAWVLLIASAIGWPTSMLFTDEPPFILSLSWLAIVLTAADMLWTAQIEEKK